MIEPEIRSYQSGDQERVENFFFAARQSTLFPFDPEGAHSDIRRISSEYQTRGGGFWLLCLGDELVGTVAVRRLPDNAAEVKRLNVLMEHRGKGYGDLLLRHAIRHMATERFRVARLDTIRNPGAAVHLFAKYGFTEIPRYNSNPSADLFMELELTGSRATQFV